MSTRSFNGPLARAALFAALALAVGAGPADAAKHHRHKYFGVDSSAVGRSFLGPTGAWRAARHASRMGARVERMDIAWKSVQPTPTPGARNMRWTKPDDEIAAIEHYGLRPLIMIHDAPQWAHPAFDCSTQHCPPDDGHLDEWATFARAVANRYSDARPAAIEIWNSPNTMAWWSVRGPKGGPSPAHYANVWSWGANAIHKAARANGIKIPVLFGSMGLGALGNPSGKDMGLASFLGGFYSHVNRQVMNRKDGLALHAYPSKKDLATHLHSRFLRVIREARGVRNRHDPRGRRRKLWLTEIGMSTTWPNPENRATPAQQARGLAMARRRARRMRDVRAAMIFTLIETRYSPSHPEERGYGLLERGDDDSLDPKPAYCTLTRLSHRREPRGCR